MQVVLQCRQYFCTQNTTTRNIYMCNKYKSTGCLQVIIFTSSFYRKAISSLIQYTELKKKTKKTTASEEESCSPKKGVGKVASVAWRHVFCSQRLDRG